MVAAFLDLLITVQGGHKTMFVTPQGATLGGAWHRWLLFVHASLSTVNVYIMEMPWPPLVICLYTYIHIGTDSGWNVKHQ